MPDLVIRMTKEEARKVLRILAAFVRDDPVVDHTPVTRPLRDKVLAAFRDERLEEQAREDFLGVCEACGLRKREFSMNGGSKCISCGDERPCF